MDTNTVDVAAAKAAQLDSHLADARNANLLETEAMLGMGNVLALTDNEDLNLVVCQRLADAVGRDHVFSWVSGRSNTDMKSSGTSQTVWAGIPKPSMISAELEDGTARLVTEDLPLDENAPAMHLLAVSHNDKVQLVVDSAATASIPADGRALKLWRITESLARWLRRDSVFVLEAQTFDEAVEYLVRKAAETDDVIDPEPVTDEIQKREKIHPTNLGNGVAIPHAYVQGLKRPRLLAARVNGIQTDPDSLMPPIMLLFLVLSPRNRPQQHLEIMGEIARLVHDPQNREVLFAATNPETIWNQLTGI